MTTLKRLLSILWPPTKKKLHRLVSIVGTAFAAFAIVYAWAGQLGLGTSGKIAATLGMLATYAAAWNSVRPKIDASINGLPIPDDDVVVVKTETKTTVTRTPSDEAKTPALVTPRDKDGGKSVPSVFGLFLIVIALSFLAATAVNVAFERVARAGDATPQLGACIDAANTWCVQPATAVGWQLNLKTGDLKNAAVLVGYSIVHQAGFALGAGIYGGVGLSSDSPNAPQANLIVSLGNFGGVGVGVQRAKFADGATAWQGLVGLFGNLTFGGTPSYLAKAAKP